MMVFSTQLDYIRSLLLRLHSHAKRKARISPSSSKYSVLGSCLGRLKSFRSSPATQDNSRRKNRTRSRRRRRKKRRNVSFDGDIIEAPMVTSSSSLPSVQAAFESFTTVHPEYLETLIVDELREEEYSELQAEGGHVCLDYSGHGLFSHLQQELDASSSSFVLSQAPGDLVSMASCHAEEGTVEFDIRRRIMGFLNIQEGEYNMFFTDSKSSAFKLLGEAYPFGDGYGGRSLLTMFDYESEAVNSLEEIARRAGSQSIMNAKFHFPSLSVCSSEMKSQLVHLLKKNGAIDPGKKWDSSSSEDDERDDLKSPQSGTHLDKKKKKKHNLEEKGETKVHISEAKGLFVFPVQSRVSGTKYSYQWMSLAQDNGWHVLLDASAVGPKDMDCLGLSLFRPDFIITSFYKVFGSDPTGFGCLFVKNSSMHILRSPSFGHNLGIVRLVAPVVGDDDEVGNKDIVKRARKNEYTTGTWHAEVAFSGPVNSTFSSETPKVSLCSQIEEDAPNPNTILALPRIHLPLKDGDIIEDLGMKFKSHGTLTPRSVLEECHLEGQCSLSYNTLEEGSIEGQSSLSYNGQKTIEDSNRSNSGCLNALLRRQERGESSTVSKESVLTDMESTRHSGILMPIHNPRKSDIDKTRFWPSYHSHEIFGPRHRRSNAIISDPGSFSQPLDMKNNHLPLNIGNEVTSIHYMDDSEDSLDFSSSLYDDDDNEDGGYASGSDLDHVIDDASLFETIRRDPEIYCRGLNHADALGLKKTNDRLGLLINWLVSSLLNLHHHAKNLSTDESTYTPLVHVYGPKVKYDRGASMAFNLFDCNGSLIPPTVVQTLAKAHNISIGIGILAHINEDCLELIQGHRDGGDDKFRSLFSLKVVTATLGFFTNFEDVYRLWAFVAKFLDPRFVKDEPIL